jgi:hypothetical protein
MSSSPIRREACLPGHLNSRKERAVQLGKFRPRAGPTGIDERKNGLQVLKSDSRAIFSAAAHAQRAADYLNAVAASSISCRDIDTTLLRVSRVRVSEDSH